MKSNFTRLIAILFAVAVLYASCTKMANKPNTVQTTDYATLSSTIAVNLAKSLNGNYGGASLNDGIKAPSSLTPGHKSLVLNGISLCGYTIDTTLNTTSIAGDTTKTSKGNFKFIYTCSANSVNGYILHDSLTNTQIGLTFNNLYMVSQNYTVTALDQTYKVYSFNGSIQTAATNKILNGTVVTGYHNFFGFYTLTNMQANITSGISDVTAGVATFNMTKADENPNASPTSMNLTGKIEFLGNHSAKVTIDPNHVYMVNLLTGTVTAI